jgi:hypothetical protein
LAECVPRSTTGTSAPAKALPGACGHARDTFAADPHALTEKLVRDAALAGHSTGTGDVTRYLPVFDGIADLGERC